MRIRLVSLEDGVISCGFRRMASFVASLNPDTEAYWVCTSHYRNFADAILGRTGDEGWLSPESVDEIARSLVDADLVGFSSMTGYSGLTKAIASRIRELAPGSAPFLVWGGIHPILSPEDAIQGDVDAVCIGEGEFAFQEFLAAFAEGRDFTGVRNMWFKNGETITRNGFRPLMTSDEMEAMPFPMMGDPSERIYKRGRGFTPMATGDYLDTFGLSYETVWSIGCPFHCSFCGNTKFIANDKAYTKIRHTSARYLVEHVQQVRERLPHVSSVTFDDDSFMAIPLRELQVFAEEWREKVGIPFCVTGVIPNYVQRDKFEVLTWAGLNRIRMGVQSGSQDILDFYKRPVPREKILAAGEVTSSFSPRYHIPPAYDVIMDNPVETRQDVVDTLELFYEMSRPFTLLIYSLKIIPNTGLEKQMRERGLDVDSISKGYFNVPPRWANIMLYLIALWRPPRWLWERLLERVEASGTEQRSYVTLQVVMRALYLAKRGFNHVRFMDFSIIPGWTGYVLWRLGVVGLWQRRVKPRPPRPVAAGSPAVALESGSD